jgi:hypothetical protein
VDTHAGHRALGRHQAARTGYNIEDGVTLEERIKAAALSLGRAGGASLQVPADTGQAAYRGYNDMQGMVDDLHVTGQVIEPDDLEAYIAAIMAREGEDDPAMAAEIAAMFNSVQPTLP